MQNIANTYKKQNNPREKQIHKILLTFLLKKENNKDFTHKVLAKN